MSGLVILFMLFDGISKLMLVPQVVEATNQIGYPANVIRPIGIILLLCTILYAVPRTAITGAILLWGGLYFRDQRVRGLIPLRYPAVSR